MGNTTKISWTQKTWNIAVGCTKVVLRDEAGAVVPTECKNCYMMRFYDGRMHKQVNGTVTKTKRGTFEAPLNWQRNAAKEGKKYLVFTSSLTDVFHEQVDPYRDEMWAIIRRCPNLIFQILTKRPERIRHNLPPGFSSVTYPNVWIGVSAGTQEALRQRVPFIADLDCSVRFVSVEPILEKVDIRPYTDSLDWVIIGGKSGHGTAPQGQPGAAKYGYRESDIEWYMDVLEACISDGVPVFMKQLGTHLAKCLGLRDNHGADMDELLTVFNVAGMGQLMTTQQVPDY